MLAFHIRARLHICSETSDIRLADRSVFQSDEEMDEFLAGTRYVIHCAAQIKGEGQLLVDENIRLAKRLVEGISRQQDKPNIIYLNSTMSLQSGDYGEGKKRAANILSEFAEEVGIEFIDVILPNVFGEQGRAFHNSAVSTFCYQLANRIPCEVTNNKTLELVHAYDVAESIYAMMNRNNQTLEHQTVRMRGVHISVQDLLDRLKSFYQSYCGNVIPKLPSKFDKSLFNVLLQFCFAANPSRVLAVNSDTRGHLFEALRSEKQGQSFVSVTHPNIVRGNHFHTRKFERFLVISGDAIIAVRRLFSDQTHYIQVSGSSPVAVDMPTFHTHSIQNVGKDDLITMFWSDEFFDANSSDTYGEAVYE